MTRIAGWLAVCLCGAACIDPVIDPHPTITFFGSSAAVVTSGTDQGGLPVQATLRLDWQTRLADDLAVHFEGSRLSLTSCRVLVEGSDCVRDGSLDVEPTETGTYTLQALRGAGSCARDDGGRLQRPLECDEAEVLVAVVPPALATLQADSTSIAVDGFVVLSYSVRSAAGWRLGTVELDGQDEVLVPCLSEVEAAGVDPPPACLLPVGPDGLAMTDAQITVGPLQQTTTFSLVAINGAADDLGGIRLREVAVTIDVF